MPLRPVPCTVALRTMSPGALFPVMPLRPPVTVMPSIVTRLALTLMTSIAGSGPLTVALGMPAASVTSLRSISRCSLQVPLIWMSKGLLTLGDRLARGAVDGDGLGGVRPGAGVEREERERGNGKDKRTTCFHGPSLFCHEPFPSLGVGRREKHAPPFAAGQVPAVPKTG